MTDYTGKVVFVERENPTKNHSGYYDGEYIIIRQTPNQLIGASLSGDTYGLSAYGLSTTRSLPLVGEARYRIVSVGEVPGWVDGILDRIEKELDDVEAGRVKRQWVDYVYTKARVNLYALRDVLKPKAKAVVEFYNPPRMFAARVPGPGEAIVLVQKGTKVEVREL